MPKKVMDYSNTHFYKIVCKDLNIKDWYVGHTTNFIKRKHKHKSTCSSPSNPDYNLPLYKFIRENGDWINWDMILINTECVDNQLEARKKQREYIQQLSCSLNKTTPFLVQRKKQKQIEKHGLKITATV